MRKVRILTFHKILNKNDFESQINYLVQKYKTIDGEQKFLITADDGDSSFYFNAFPILKKYNLPAILFIITDLIDTEQPFWWDEIEYYLGKEEGYKKVWEVKKWPNKCRMAFLEDLREKSKKPLLKHTQLTVKQLKEMQRSGIIIANHSHTHPMFDKCTEEEVEKEIKLSTQKLRELGFSSEYFAYPNGNFSHLAEKKLKKYGVQKAYLFDHKINKGETNSFRISRLIVNDTTPMWKYRLILSGWHTKILPFTRFAEKIKRKLRN